MAGIRGVSRLYDNLDGVFGGQVAQPVWPFDQNKAGGQGLFPADFVEFFGVFEAVKVKMVDFTLWCVIGLDKGEGRAGDVEFRLSGQGADNRAGKDRFPHTQIPPQQNDIPRAQRRGKIRGDGNGFGFGGGGKNHLSNPDLFSYIYPMSDHFQTDVAIIGAGPVGLFAVFQCGMLGFKAHVVDSLDQIGGQCTALYPEKPIYDIPAEPSISGAELIEQLEQQAAPFAPVYHLGQQVTGLAGEAGHFTLTTSKGAIIAAKAVIIAAGAGAFGPNRPPIDNIRDFEGRSVFYAVRNRELFRGKKIVIAGGGDSAVDWANALAEIAAKITVVHRRDKFRAAPASLEKLQEFVLSGAVELVTPYQLSALSGHGGLLQQIEVVDMDGAKRVLDADILLPFFGLSTALGPVAEWGLSLDHHQIVVTQGTAETSVAGIYAVGDIATYPHKLRLILTGFADAAQAAHAIYTQIYPDTPLHFEYSTTKGVAGSS